MSVPVLSADDIVQLQDMVPSVKIDTAIVNYILDVAEATRLHDQIHLGLSPRGTLALTAASQAAAVLHGRDFVTPDDVKALVIPVCAHRIISKAHLHNGDSNATSRILQQILDQVPTPS